MLKKVKHVNKHKRTTLKYVCLSDVLNDWIYCLIN